jgi:CBS domain-containing membrane protein
MKPKGQQAPRHSVKEMWQSWAGGFLGVYAIVCLGMALEGFAIPAVFLIGSFGASAVLVYGAPFADFSQPRNVIGGHLVSAVVGVLVCRLLGPDTAFAAALAVATAILAMHWTRTLHPPGGATALIAVTGGPKVLALGWWYVVSPVALGALALVGVGLVVNNLSRNPRRHYPVYWYY